MIGLPMIEKTIHLKKIRQRVPDREKQFLKPRHALQLPAELF